MDTVECITSRQSFRQFKPHPVHKETIVELIDIAANVPSWKNAQPTRYILVESEGARAELIANAMPDFNARIVKSAPALIAVTALKRRSGYERDGTASTAYGDGYEFFDCGVATQTLCLAAWSKGYGSVIIGVFNDMVAREILKVPDEQDIVAFVALGVPDTIPAKVKKKDSEALLRFV